MIKITKDDLLLFRYLFEQKVLERDTIKNFIWKHKSNSYIDNRLSELIKYDFIKKISHPFKRRERLLSGTERAIDFLESHSSSNKSICKRNNSILKYFNVRRYSVYDNFDIRKIKHDLIMNKIRFIFEDFGVNYWYSQTMIQNSNINLGFYPDSRFTLNEEDYYIELDINDSFKRYNDTLKKYKVYGFKAIYIFYDEETIERFLKELDLFDRNIFYGTYKQIENGNFKFVSSSNDTLDLERRKNA